MRRKASAIAYELFSHFLLSTCIHNLTLAKLLVSNLATSNVQNPSIYNQEVRNIYYAALSAHANHPNLQAQESHYRLWTCATHGALALACHYTANYNSRSCRRANDHPVPRLHSIPPFRTIHSCRARHQIRAIPVESSREVAANPIITTISANEYFDAISNSSKLEYPLRRVSHPIRTHVHPQRPFISPATIALSAPLILPSVPSVKAQHVSSFHYPLPIARCPLPKLSPSGGPGLPHGSEHRVNNWRSKSRRAEPDRWKSCIRSSP